MTVDEFKKLVEARAGEKNFTITMHQARQLKKHIDRLQQPKAQPSSEPVDLHGADF